MTQAKLIKLLAGVSSSGAVVAAIDNLHSPWKEIAAAVVAGIAAYVNWASHKAPGDELPVDSPSA